MFGMEQGYEDRELARGAVMRESTKECDGGPDQAVHEMRCGRVRIARLSD